MSVFRKPTSYWLGGASCFWLRLCRAVVIVSSASQTHQNLRVQRRIQVFLESTREVRSHERQHVGASRRQDAAGPAAWKAALLYNGRTNASITASCILPCSRSRLRSTPSRIAPAFSATRRLAAFSTETTTSRRTRGVVVNSHSTSSMVAAVATPLPVAPARTQ